MEPSVSEDEHCNVPSVIARSVSQRRSNLRTLVIGEIASQKTLAMTGHVSAIEVFPNDVSIALMVKQMSVYILTNKLNTVVYTGVTSNLKRRVYEHKKKIKSKFTARYNVNKLVYYEVFSDSYNAIAREKQIKAGSRQKKIDLINAANPKWIDLYDEI
jgi:putative endonuclease